MSKKKGLSAEEKRTRMIQLFYEKKDFFQLKDLEKIAPKEKGIVAQSVKDVVQSLVDDGFIDSDKIGTSVYYWAYPSKAIHCRKRKLKELEDKLIEAEEKLKRTKECLEKAKVNREDTNERQSILDDIVKLRSKKEELELELRKYKDNNPEVLEQMKGEIEKSKEAANRWTDNIFAVKSWCKNKFMVDGDALDKQFGIPTDLDYIN